MTDQPGLFDLPPPPTPPPASRSGRGRTGQTWARTVTADVTVVIGEFADDDPDLTDPRDNVAQSCAAAVQWCLEPTEGIWPLQEAGAVRIDQVELAATDHGPGRVRVSWTVTVRIADAEAVRELARSACPAGDVAARAEVDAGFAAAWNRAADPHMPLHPVPSAGPRPASTGAPPPPSRVGRRLRKGINSK